MESVLRRQRGSSSCLSLLRLLGLSGIMFLSLARSSSSRSAMAWEFSTQNLSRVALRQQQHQHQQQQQHQHQQQRTFFWSNLSKLSASKEEVDPGVVEGTDLRIVKYPHPSLRAENVEISLDKADKEKAAEIADISKQMLKVMYAADGVGLAAPQVGINQRLMVYNPTGKWLDETILLNPKIIEYSTAKDVETEGCLSFPDMGGDVERSKWIKVEAMTLKGKKIKKKFTGWEARIFQHEYDHLDGVVYIDRLGEKDKERVQPRLNELIEEFGEGGAL